MQHQSEPGGLKQNIDYNKTYNLKDPDHDEIRDGYQLRWVGKDYAKLQENLLPETVVVPDSRHNADAVHRDSKNLFLTGDNLEVLKHLEHSYTDKVDVIYIDPPYNTGSDGFVYADNFHFSDEQLQDTLGLTEGEVKKIRNIYGKASHSAWLTFMYPRLKLAKKLLKDDGILLASIDHNEQANLRLLLDDIFNGNYLGEFIWHKKLTGGYDNDNINMQHEYIYAYAKRKNSQAIQKLARESKYKLEDEKGKYKWDSLWNMGGLTYSASLDYPIVAPDGSDVYPPGERGVSFWVFGRERVERERDQLKFVQKDDGSWRIYRKIYASEGLIPESLLDKTIVKGNTHSSKEIKNLFDGVKVFDYPKPTDLLAFLIERSPVNDPLVLDFFAGSGTTAHAVMALNKRDGGKRKYIMCTLDEAVNPKSEAAKAGYQTIDEIARRRIDMAAAQLGDTSGYRHYRFVHPRVDTLEKLDDVDLSRPTIVAEDMVTPFSEYALTNQGEGTGVTTLLTTWLADDGYGFDVAPETVDLAGYTAHYAPDIARLYIIDNDGWTSDACHDLLNKIGKNEISVNAIVVYSYSLNFTDMTELKNNLRANLDRSPQLIQRY